MVCQDMFFSRSRTTPTSRALAAKVPITGGSAPNSRTALEAAFHVTSKTQTEKSNVVGELLDVRVTDPLQNQFSEEVWLYHTAQ